VLEYVQFDGRELVSRLQMAVEIAVREGRVTHEDAGRILKFYEEGLHGYTYLEGPDA
jgi:arginine decarboxylase